MLPYSQEGFLHDVMRRIIIPQMIDKVSKEDGLIPFEEHPECFEVGISRTCNQCFVGFVHEPGRKVNGNRLPQNRNWRDEVQQERLSMEE